MNISDSGLYHKVAIVIGKDMILVVYDQLLKIVHFVTTTKEIIVEDLMRLFRDNM